MPVLAGQIHQESHWSPTICSTFACGLAQFTPATADWISGAYPKELGAKNVFDPEWAIRALVIYDRKLLGQTPAVVPCDNWAFALSAYNGGLGWVYRDQKLCTGDCQSALWWGNVELHTGRGPAAAAENRGYPRRILLTNQSIYATWGAPVPCSPI